MDVVQAEQGHKRLAAEGADVLRYVTEDDDDDDETNTAGEDAETLLKKGREEAERKIRIVAKSLA